MVIFLNPPSLPWLGFLWKSGGGPDAEGLTLVGTRLLRGALSRLSTSVARISRVGTCLEAFWGGKHPWGVVWNPLGAGGRTADRFT